MYEKAVETEVFMHEDRYMPNKLVCKVGAVYPAQGML
jgi:hypothetical protein